MDTENKENEEIQNELEVSESVENVSNVSEESIEATESDVVKSEVVETAVVESEPSNKEEPEVSKKEDKKSKKEKKESPKAKKEKKKFEAKNLRMNVSETYEKVQSNVPLYIGVAIASFFVVVMAAVATFFLTVKGPEQVLQLLAQKFQFLQEDLVPKLYLHQKDLAYIEEFQEQSKVLFDQQKEFAKTKLHHHNFAQHNFQVYQQQHHG